MMSFGHSQNTENYYSLDNHNFLSISRGFFFNINMKIDILKPNHITKISKTSLRIRSLSCRNRRRRPFFYAQYNKLDAIKKLYYHLYIDKEPIACGAYKKYDDQTIEVKRMFTKEKIYRGKGYAKMVLLLLEKWAKEEGIIFLF